MGPITDKEEIEKMMRGERVFNRRQRRQKPPTDNQYTKATHKIKKERAKNAPSKQQRTRAIANARKARKEGYTQVS